MVPNPAVTAPPQRPPSRVRRFWAPPDEYLRTAGKAGELLIAKIRLGLVLALTAIPAINVNVVSAEQRSQHMAALWVGVLASLVAGIVYWAIALDRRQTWLPPVTTLLDVTLISSALGAYAFTGDPHLVTNSKSTFEAYFIAIGATCLRYDWRLSFVAGVAAVTQYLILLIVVVGLFNLDAPGLVSEFGRFRWTDQLSRLVLLATATGLAMLIVREMQRQRELVTTDPLTGIFNRRFFDDYFANEIARARRAETPVSVVMVDIDHFKRFNDVHGHAVGDTVLRRVAELLRDGVRRSDLVARYGGEEFVVIFRDTPAAQAVERIDVIRKAIAAEALPVARDQGPAHVTVSAGVATWPADGGAPEVLLAEADRRLFQAKNDGRDRVVGPPT
ncbi:MAG: GGDEF domain-containing protein [Gemmatimonadales bacterium]